MAKLKDIAMETGYSIATVSRVLNHDNSFKVPDETRRKVLSAAQRLNYVSNSKKNRLENEMIRDEITVVNDSKKLLRFGLAYSYSPSDEIIDPYYLSIKSAIGESCEASGVDLKVFYMHERNYEDIAYEKLDGLIALGKFNDHEIAELHKLNPHFILADCYTKHPNIDVVMVDLKVATKEIIDYLKDKGITSIGFIGGIESNLDGKIIEDVRLRTFLKYADEDEDSIYLGRLSAESGYEMMNNIIKKKSMKSAYIVSTDVLALGCLKALNEHKIEIPNEISIIAYNNSILSEFMSPALSTVDLNTHYLGATVTETLLERIRSGRTYAKKIYLPSVLITRKSSF